MVAAIHNAYTIQVFAPLVIIFAAIMTRTDRKLLMRLRDAQATTPERALTLEPLSGLAGMRLRRLTDGGAVVVTPDGRYFLDESGWTQLRTERRRRAASAIAIVLFAAVLVFLFAR